MDADTASTLPGARADQDSSHGGNLAEARALFPRAPEPFIDLSTGINPAPYPVPDLPPDIWHRLPEPEEIAALEAIAARTYGVAAPEMAVAIPGTQILISLLPHLLPAQTVAVLGPTYGEYASAWSASGSQVEEVDSVVRLTDAVVGVICNPNNPDGRRLSAAAILNLLRDRNEDGLLVVDEAFADLEEASLSVAPRLPQDGLLVLRSFSKSYGLAGLRLGFALAGPELAARLRNALGPWRVSGPAIAIGTGALADAAWREATRARLQTDIVLLDQMLTAAGVSLVGGTRLFRLTQSGDAPALFTKLGEAGIFVRRFARRPDWLRFGIPGDDEAWQRLAAILRG